MAFSVVDICPVQGLPQEREEEEEEEEEVDTELTTLASKWFPAAIVRGKKIAYRLIVLCCTLHSVMCARIPNS